MVARIRNSLWLTVVGAVVAMASGGRRLPKPVTLHYVQRPPYMMAAGEGLTGLTGGPSYLAFKTAKVAVVVKETPFARQLYYLEKNTGRDCMIGMFRRPEREAFAKYSKPVYQDQPQVIVAGVALSQTFFRFPVGGGCLQRQEVSAA